jgi:hypothetical protein
MEAIRATVPNWHFRHISQDVLPALRAAGVTEEQIDLMTVGNPRRIFERQRPYKCSSNSILSTLRRAAGRLSEAAPSPPAPLPRRPA